MRSRRLGAHTTFHDSKWLIAAALLVVSLPASAATITVGGGCTLVDAVIAANNDTATGSCPAGSGADTIELTADITLTTNYLATQNGLPLVTTDITVNGNGWTIQRSSAASFRIFQVDPTGELTINDATISGGAGVSLAGGIHNQGALTLSNSMVSGNSALGGGGILNFGTFGTASLTNVTLSGNSATSGDGGAIYNVHGVVTLDESTLSANSATNVGGGIYSTNATLTISNSTFSENSATFGGGVFSPSGTVTLTHSTFSGNSATITGGGIRINGGTTTLTNSIVANSSSGGNCFGTITDGGNNFDDDGTCPAIQVVPGSLINATLADNGGPTQTHALVPGSAAIDAAGACGLTTDQRGVLRNDGTCDSGAYEFQASAVPALTGWGRFWLAGLLSLGLLVHLLYRRRLSAAR